MRKRIRYIVLIIPLLVLFFGITPAGANVFVQCPGDSNGDGVSEDPNEVCVHLSAGDGFTKMANVSYDRNGDGTIDSTDDQDLYMFSFGLVPPGTTPDQVLTDHILKQQNPAPLITVRQGQDLFLNLTNVGMIMRPDLFDDHTVHWHGFPNAAVVFDGVPDNSIAPNMASTLTYYYAAEVPGTYFYHCHVEAAEHMQMGMIGNIWIRPGQDLLTGGTDLNGYTHNNTGDADNPPYGNFPGAEDVDGGTAGVFDEGTHDKYVYNDGDGSTRYDRAYPIQLTGYDDAFHDASLAVQPLPFAAMFDNFTMVNGRGYPHSINQNDLVNQEGFTAQLAGPDTTNGPATHVSSYTNITATAGERILFRVSNVSTTHQYAIATTTGVPFWVVGKDAAHLRGPDGKDTTWKTSVLKVPPGTAFDVILDTTGVSVGTHALYTTNLTNLSNGLEERGGLMTEIVIQ